jgi:hypothetical protein
MVEQAPQYSLTSLRSTKTQPIIARRATGYDNPPEQIIRKIPSHCFFPIARVNRIRANTLLRCGRTEDFPSRHEFWRAFWRVQG